jgi:hypothetical protein
MYKYVNGKRIKMSDDEKAVFTVEQKKGTEPTKALVNRERTKRTDAGFVFDGNKYDSDPVSIRNITGAATMANFAILRGALPKDYRWSSKDKDFEWIIADNTTVKLDAHQMSQLGIAAAVWVESVIFKARALKNMEKIPEDYQDDKHW